MRTNSADDFAEVCENCKFSRLLRTTRRCHRDGPPFLPVEPFDWCDHWEAEGTKDIEYKEKYVAGVEEHDRAKVEAIADRIEARDAEEQSVTENTAEEE